MRPEYIGRSTAGPGAGGQSIFFSSDGKRVRLSLRDNSPLFMRPEKDGVVIEKNGITIVEGDIEPVGAHCPRQAYITVSERCQFHCAFCPVPHIQGPVKSTGEIHSLIEEVYKTGDLDAISLTGGIEISPDKELSRMETLVKDLIREYDVPIGVSVYPTQDSSDILYAAGADEVKYNVETMDRDLFQVICPELKHDEILASLRYAVGLFGRDHVSSNIIIGLGETDDNVISGVNELASYGVIPILRPVVIGQNNKIKGALRPSAERLIQLGTQAKGLFSQYGLSPLNARTMCLPCTGCDLTPFRDF
jgi:biotin synthase-related radical SAM superfamily protein